MFLNLAERDPAILLSSVYGALREDTDKITLELLGPGMMINDTALMLFEVLRNRPPHIHLHAHSHTCLSNGAVLIWLAADTRTIRADAWIQLCPIPKTPKPRRNRLHSNYTSGLPVEDEQPADTDLRTIMRHLDEWLPIEGADLQLIKIRYFHALQFFANFFYGRGQAHVDGLAGHAVLARDFRDGAGALKDFTEDIGRLVADFLPTFSYGFAGHINFQVNRYVGERDFTRVLNEHSRYFCFKNEAILAFFFANLRTREFDHRNHRSLDLLGDFR